MSGPDPIPAPPPRPTGGRIWLLHAGGIAALGAAQFLLPDYQQLMMTRIMVLACYASGYNLLFGYAGLLSLGHAMFFAAGMYGAGLPAYHAGWGAGTAFLAGTGAGAALALAVGLLALRTTGVAFMIVTMMFAQVAHLGILYFTEWTRGEEGLSLPAAARRLGPFDLADPVVRYNLALALLAVTLAVVLAAARAPFGRALVAIRENEPRTRMLGYDTFRLKLAALVLSGTLAAAAGAAYGLLFGYIGATFAGVQYSIEALLFTLLGGAGTVLGPLLGTALMTWMIDAASDVTSAWLLAVGVVLIGIVLFFRKGLLGRVPWLP